MKTIPLSQNEVALVDDRDFDLLNNYKWSLKTDGRGKKYAKTSIFNKVTKKTSYPTMHRFLLQVSSGLQVDHINNDGLDNRRQNIRVCNHTENQRNKSVYKNSKSGYKGVFLTTTKTGKRRYVVQISDGTKQKYLGKFKTLEEAVNKYRAASLRIHNNYSVFRRLSI